MALNWSLVYINWVRPTYGLWLPPCAPAPPKLPLEFDGSEKYDYETHRTDMLALLAIRDHFEDAGTRKREFARWGQQVDVGRGQGCGVGKWDDGIETEIVSYSTSQGTVEHCRVVGLSLDKRELKGTIPKEIGYLTKLRELNLSHNCLSGSIPAELGHLRELKSLGLNSQGSRYVGECKSRSSLSGELPPEFGRLGSLTMLNLFNNPGLSGELPPEFGNLEQLKHLKIEYTGFSGCLPPAIVQNFSDPAATGIISPILGIGAGLALTSVTGGTGYVVSVAFGEAVGRILRVVLDPIIKPGADHWLPFIGSELHNVKPHCSGASDRAYIERLFDSVADYSQDVEDHVSIHCDWVLDDEEVVAKVDALANQYTDLFELPAETSREEFLDVLLTMQYDEQLDFLTRMHGVWTLVEEKADETGCGSR